MCKKKQIIYTDDTVMAKIVLEVCAQAKTKNWNTHDTLTEIAKQFLHCTEKDEKTNQYKNDPFGAERAHGVGNRDRLDLLRARVAQQGGVNCVSQQHDWWKSTAAGENTEGGCGSVMRAWPIGLIFFNDIEYVKRLAAAQSCITHRHPMAQAACVAMAVGVAYAYQGKTIEQIVDAMYTSAAEWDVHCQKFVSSQQKQRMNWKEAATGSNGVKIRAALRTCISQNTLLPSDMILYAAAAGLAQDDEQTVFGKANVRTGPCYRSNTGSLLGWAGDEAAAASVFFLCKYGNTSNSLWTVLQRAAWTPGDSDSIASLAGALVGAYQGLNYPKSEHAALQHLENYQELLSLAQQVPQPPQSLPAPRSLQPSKCRLY